MDLKHQDLVRRKNEEKFAEEQGSRFNPIWWALMCAAIYVIAWEWWKP